MPDILSILNCRVLHELMRKHQEQETLPKHDRPHGHRRRIEEDEKFFLSSKLFALFAFLILNSTASNKILSGFISGLQTDETS